MHVVADIAAVITAVSGKATEPDSVPKHPSETLLVYQPQITVYRSSTVQLVFMVSECRRYTFQVIFYRMLLPQKSRIQRAGT